MHPPQQSRGERLRLILTLGALTAFGPMSIDMYLPAFPALQAHFAVSAGAIQTTLAVFFVGMAAGQAFYGPISDRVGRRPPLLAGISVYIAASVYAALAPDVGSLTAARLLQALGGCAGIVIARAMVADLFHEREAAKIFSLLMIVMGVGPVLAPMLGSQLLVLFAWPAIFWTLSAFGLLCLTLVFFALSETLPPERRARGGLGAVLRSYLGLMRNPRYLSFAATGSLSIAGLFTYITGSSFVFIKVYDLAPSQFGMLFGANAFGLIGMAQINVRLLRHYSGRAILTVANGLYMICAGAMALVALTGLGGVAVLIIAQFCTLATLGLVLGNANAAAMAESGALRGSGSALLGVLQFTLAALASSALSAIDAASAVPMAAQMFAFSLVAFLAGRMARRYRT